MFGLSPCPLSPLWGAIHLPGSRRKLRQYPGFFWSLFNLSSRSVSMEEWKCITQSYSKLIPVVAFAFLQLRRGACSWGRGRVGFFSPLLILLSPSHGPRLRPSSTGVQGSGREDFTRLTVAGDRIATWAPHILSAQLSICLVFSNRLLAGVA